MKKAFLVLACVSFLAVTATSCKKTCVCTDKDGNDYTEELGVISELNKTQCDLLDDFSLGMFTCGME